MNSQEVISDVAKSSPPIAVSGLTFYGVGLPEIVQIVTVVYVLLMAIDKMYVMYLRYKKKDVDEPKE